MSFHLNFAVYFFKSFQSLKLFHSLTFLVKLLKLNDIENFKLSSKLINYFETLLSAIIIYTWNLKVEQTSFTTVFQVANFLKIIIGFGL